MDSLASLDFLDQRGSLDLAFLAPQVYQDHLERKASPDRKATLASPAAPALPGALDSTALQDLKVSPVCRVYLELVAHLEAPTPAQWGRRDHPAFLAKWDPQGTPDQTEGRETPGPQV
ncbi:uncharacterized protein ACO6RY_03147 [Pungitius sinensis]